MFRIAFLAAFLAATLSSAAEFTEVAADKPVAVAASPTTPVGAAASAARSDELFGSGTLSLRDRRRLGLTIPKIARTLQDLQKDGEIEQGMSQSEMAAAVLDRLSAEDPKMYGESALDIDGILAFLERILPLILTLINLFS
jgi:hypothetical protein